MNIIALIQARMGSTRLPNKMLKDVEGKPLIEYVVNRVKKSKNVNFVVVATTDNEKDDALINECDRLGINFFRGSETDVLNRFVKAGQKYNADIVVRICADNVFIDSEEIDRLITHHIKGDFDYTTNVLQNGKLLILTPIGLAVEIINFYLLENINNELDDKYVHEHVTPYFYENPSLFKIGFLEINKKFQNENVRLTIDTQEDLEIIKDIFSKCYKDEEIRLEDVFNYIKNNQKILDKMNDVNRRNMKGR
jgi:spore coat polysaccharide biosynthesis protein SpsF